MKTPVRLVLLSCATLHLAIAAETSAANPTLAAPVPVPATTPTPSTGVSGPGAIFSLDGPVYRQRRRPHASAVQAGLIPPLRPLLDLHIRDTIVRLGADGNYYMTGSTGADIWNKAADGIELWRSADLKKWDYLGVVWNLEREGTWEKRHAWGKYAHAIWAPEIVYIKRLKNYFLTYSLPPGDRGILKSASGQPGGPYVNALAGDSKLKGGIDLSLFEDDDGSVYATWGPNLLARMKDDLSGLAEEPHNPKLTDPDKDPAHHGANCPKARDCQDIGHEGPCLFKHDGKYYLTAADTYEGRYSSMAAISDDLYGPYHHRHEAVPGGAGGDYFQDKEGNWWCTYFGNDGQSPWREMPAIVKIEFDQSGLIHVAKNQPAFVLLDGAPRTAAGSRSPASAASEAQP
jgi:xylan 1,4-beta-xylosidase